MQQTLHFCGAHARIMRHDEDEALRQWQVCMQRAVTAFVQCRVDDARNCFSAALEIALLRFSCLHNKNFGAQQLVKPSEFLCQMDLAEDRRDQAASLLQFVKQIIDAKSLACGNREMETLDLLEERIRHANKSQNYSSNHRLHRVRAQDCRNTVH